MTTFNANDPTASGMVLTFDDEFDSNDTSDNGVASGTQWANHIWYEGADPGAVSVSNGVLSLAPGGSLSTTNTAGQGFSQEYGYFEIDMKLPSTNGSWPAFWLESLAHALDPNAPSSEIDVIEGQGVYPDGYWATLHYNSSSQGPAGADQQNADNFTGNLGTNLSAGFNRYGVLWSPTSNNITFYFNGNPILTVPDYSTTNTSAMMVLIDNWIGNMGAGVANNGSGGGALEVDYVRVYQFASQDPTAVVAQAVSPAAGQTDPTALANADGVTSGGSTSGSGTSDPPPPTPSASGTIVTGTSGDIVTAAGNTFAINASGQITENGTALTDTASVTELAYIGGTLYQENVAHDWWSFNETTNAWTSTSDPLTTTSGSGSTGSTGTSDPPPTPSANGTVVTGTNGDIVTAAHNTFAINASGAITENGTVMAETHGVTELAYVGGTLYQEATSSDLWWSYNETTNAWTSTSDPLPHAVAPSLTVYEATGSENSAIPLYISAAQGSSALAASNLTVTVSGLDGATLSASTESNGVYTLSAAQLSGLTVTPAEGFTGTLALHVQATDIEAGLNNQASSAADTIDVSVTAPSTSEAMLSPSFTDGTHSVYMPSWPPESNEHIANFDPSTDILDLAPVLKAMGVTSSDPLGQHIVDLEATSNGCTAIVIDPSGDNPSHGTMVLTLDHVLPQSIPAADIWH